MKKLSKMAYVNIVDKTHEALKGREVTYDNIKNSFVDDKDFNTLRMFLSIYAKGMFRVYYKEHDEEHIKKVMEFRREFYLHEPIDEEEYSELITYFESEEDYETCSRLKKNNKVIA